MSKDLQVKTAKDLQIGDNGLPITKTIEEQLLYADSLLRSGMLPKSYTKASEVLAGMQMASELGLQPGVKSLSRTANINGTPSIYSEMPLAVCQSKGVVADFEGYHFDKNLDKICIENKNISSEIFGYYFRIKRTGSDTYHTEYYTVKQAKDAGLYSGKYSVWNKHPEDMLKWRTIGKALKIVFADVLSGSSIAEYDYNTMPTGNGEYIQTNIGHDSDSPLNERLEQASEESEPEIETIVEVPEVIEEAEIVEESEPEVVPEVVESKKKVETKSAPIGAPAKKEAPVDKEPKEDVMNRFKDDAVNPGKVLITMGPMKGKEFEMLKKHEAELLHEKVLQHKSKVTDPKGIELIEDFLVKSQAFLDSKGWNSK